MPVTHVCRVLRSPAVLCRPGIEAAFGSLKSPRRASSMRRNQLNGESQMGTWTKCNLLARRFLTLVFLGTVLAAGASSGCAADCPAGEATCSCRSDSTCDTGLTCSSGRCEASGTTGGTCGGVDNRCSAAATTACGMCVARCCCDEASACANNAACSNLAKCVSNCPTSSSTCIDNCMSAFPGGTTLLANYDVCTIGSCENSCG
jgi:hypothetical protein